MAKVYRIRTAQWAGPGGGYLAWAGDFSWHDLHRLHLLTDVREPVRVLNPTGKHPVTGCRTALWGRLVVDMVGLSGGFSIRRQDQPEWWDRTEPEARELVGLDP